VEDWGAMVVESCVLGLRHLGQIDPLKKIAQGLNPKWNAERSSYLICCLPDLGHPKN